MQCKVSMSIYVAFFLKFSQVFPVDIFLKSSTEYQWNKFHSRVVVQACPEVNFENFCAGRGFRKSSTWVFKSKFPKLIETFIIYETCILFSLGLVWEKAFPKVSLILRSSRPQMFFKIGVLKHFAISTGKYLCWRLFLIRLQAWRPATLFKRDSTIGVFLWILQSFVKIAAYEFSPQKCSQSYWKYKFIYHTTEIHFERGETNSTFSIYLITLYH